MDRSFVIGETQAKVDPSGPLPNMSPLARQYLNALLQSDRDTALKLVMDAMQQGADVRDIYIHVFQATQRQLGLLWQTNQVSVAREHYCTATTQLVMSQLYPYVFGRNRCGRRLVIACVSDELHEIGARMVADFLEMEGWDTHFLGANTPGDSVVQVVTEQKPDLLGVSATMTYHVPAVRELVRAVRASPATDTVKIIVGGYPFSAIPDLWRDTSADGFASDAEEAVSIAKLLTPYPEV